MIINKIKVWGVVCFPAPHPQIYLAVLSVCALIIKSFRC